MNYEDLRRTADRVARQLHADLKSGKLKKIGIEEIRQELLEEQILDPEAGEFLEQTTTRRVVELAS